MSYVLRISVINALAKHVQRNVELGFTSDSQMFTKRKFVSRIHKAAITITQPRKHLHCSTYGKSEQMLQCGH